MNETEKKGKWSAFGSGAFQVFIGLGGVYGGMGLVSEPSGANLGLSLESLSESPFSDYLIPGIVLFVVIGVGSLAGGVAFLVMWIVAQVWWIGLTFWLQPLFFGIGVVELLLGLLLRRALHVVH